MGSGCSRQHNDKGVAAMPPKVPHLKIALVGDPEVGKTSIMLRYVRNQFSPMYIPTKKVAIETVTRKLNVPAHAVVSLTLWDIPGREDMDIHHSYFKNLDAAIVVADMTNESSISMANVWKQIILNRLSRSPDENDNENDEVTPTDVTSFPVLLLGNKFDCLEEKVLEEMKTKQVSVSMNFDLVEQVQRHRSVELLEDTADQHNFVGSLLVSARQNDDSVAMAIQSLVRKVLQKQNLPRKWKPIEKTSKMKKEKEIIYDHLELTGIDLFDEAIKKADNLVKQCTVLLHYYAVACARWKDVCIKGGLVKADKSSFEDCIFGLKRHIREGSMLQVYKDEGFYRLEIEMSHADAKVKQTRPWNAAFRCFHNEYAAVSKSVLKEGPIINTALEKYDTAMDKMTEDVRIVDSFSSETPTQRPDQRPDLHKAVEQIEKNRAQMRNMQVECIKCIHKVEADGQKISNVNLW